MQHRAPSSVLAATLAVAALTGCPRPATSPATPGTPAADSRPFDTTMAGAPTHAIPAALSLVAPCNESGYLRFAVPAGAAFAIEVAPAAGCAMVAVLDASGAMPGGSTEVCADAPRTITGTGDASAVFVTVSETGACTGKPVALAVK